ncbi:MAG: ribosome maturation factor RimP [Pseudomonadota bacterium]
MGSLETTLTTLITPILDELGFELVRLRLTGARTKTVQIMAERPDGTMSAEDCAQLSRRISVRFEEEDPISDAYVLEVSSPGIDRPLTREKDFIRWEGHLAKLELDRMIEGRKKFRGTLAGMDDGHVAFDIEGEEETALFPPAWIVQAKLLMTDDLIRESLRHAKAGGATSPDIEFTDTEETPAGDDVAGIASANDP